MATTIVITCPACKKQLKGPADLQGKKVRCKACGQTFAVKAAAAPASNSKAPAANAKVPAANAKAPAANAKVPAANAKVPAANAKVAAPPKPTPEDSAQSNPYKISVEEVSVPRCPHCAFELEEGQIVCLECGYNIETRMRATVVKTYQSSKSERTLWLLPGVLSAIYMFLALATIVFLWFGLDRLAGDAWYTHFSIKIYGSVLFAFSGWAAMKFALKRLIKDPNPPERLKL